MTVTDINKTARTTGAITALYKEQDSVGYGE